MASLLWVVASGVQHRDSLTITDKSAYWVMPGGVAKVPFAEIQDISFVGKKKKKTRMQLRYTTKTGMSKHCKVHPYVCSI